MIAIAEFNIFFEFTNGFSEIDEFEMPLKGYRDDIIVHCPNQLSYQLCFYDIVRLAQDVEEEHFIFEKHLIVVEEITISNIQAAIAKMFKCNFFDELVPLS